MEERGSSMPKTRRMRETSCTAVSECPPSAKKSSSRPTCSRPRSCANSWAMRTSCSPRGGSEGARGSGSEIGSVASALRSTLPLELSGSASNSATCEGTIASGSRAASCSRSSRPVIEPSDTTNASRRAWPLDLSTSAAAWRTPGMRRSAASTSSSSSRTPRTFTWKSARPRKEREPSSFQRTRSPVRYMRAPGAFEKGSERKRCAVRSGRLR